MQMRMSNIQCQSGLHKVIITQKHKDSGLQLNKLSMYIITC